MEVKLMSISTLSPDYPTVADLTPADSLVAYAIAKCYQTEPNNKAILRCLNSGHTSVFEHLSFTFDVTDISRICLAQLTRHRIASYTVESQRYTNYSKSGKTIALVIPDTMMLHTPVKTMVNAHYKGAVKIYDMLIKYGIPPEDARFVLPQGVATRLTMTFNARSLMNAFSLRLDGHAQWEIRELFSKIYHIVQPLAPMTFSNVKAEDI